MQENYCFSMKNSINDDKIKEKVKQEDKETITKTLEDALKWLDDNQEADKEVFENKQKEVEEICKPIMMKLYQQQTPTGMPSGAEGEEIPGMSGMPGGTMDEDDSGPNIEEVD